jgi:ATP-binding cassette, subfamily F, member 3
MAEIAHF